MTNVNPYSTDFSQDVDHEGRFFENLQSLAESESAEPGDEFEVEVQLIPATGYFNNERSILIQEGVSTLGLLPPDAVDKWWQLACAMKSAAEDLEVNAMVWTSPNWDEKFYASVRLALPSIEEGFEEVKDDRTALTLENLNSHTNFSNEVVDYLVPAWREAHGMTDEQYQAEVAKTRQSMVDMGYKFDKSGKMTATPPSTSVPTPRPSPPSSALAQPSMPLQPAEGSVDWAILLRPDGTPRATPFQRGFVRGKVGKHFPGKKAPRIDYVTVGQCQKILSHFGEDHTALTEGGRGSMKVWWLFVGILTVLAAILSAIPGIGGVFPLIGIIVIIHHFWTRRKLEPPFTQQ